jgi:hypothetical protein
LVKFRLPSPENIKKFNSLKGEDVFKELLKGLGLNTKQPLETE